MDQVKEKSWSEVKATENGYCDDCRKCDHPVIWEVRSSANPAEWNDLCPRCLKKCGAIPMAEMKSKATTDRVQRPER